MALLGCMELINIKAWNGCQGCLVEYGYGTLFILTDAKEIPCKSAVRPVNGHLRCNSKKESGFFAVGTKCKLKCNRGFVPVIESGKRCMPTGQWAGPEAECQPLSCPNIDPVPNSRVSPTSCLAGNQVPPHLHGQL